jgi:hypothetical protein
LLQDFEDYVEGGVKIEALAEANGVAPIER